MATASVSHQQQQQQFEWTPQPRAAALVNSLVSRFLDLCPPGAALRDRLLAEAGVRLADLVDAVYVPADDAIRAALADAGFAEEEPYRTEDTHVYAHPGGIFPRVVVRRGGATELALKVESVADFAAVHHVHADIDGPPIGPYRRLEVWSNALSRACLSVVERHGYRGFSTRQAQEYAESIDPLRWLHHLERFRARPREFADEADGFAATEALIDAAADDVGLNVACDLFFTAEREYWQRRNRAGRAQKLRQDALGIGWANHDHHTYRCSRRHFARLVAVWERLGFVCRERFYAGAEAGWGAQVMEHAATGIVTFNDVDLSPDELLADFAHEPLPERDRLGTVGLWCALHGESFLHAGMHHLECQFSFDMLKGQLESDAGIKVMEPFTDFPFLRQAFTEGERWPVREARIDPLLRDRLISAEQAERFRREGAIGSHLENLERNEGFKGFNQKGVSEIIAATDPRKHLRA